MPGGEYPLLPCTAITHRTPTRQWHRPVLGTRHSHNAGRHKERVEAPSVTTVDDWRLFSCEPPGSAVGVHVYRLRSGACNADHPGLRVCRVPSDWSVPFDDAKIEEKELAGAEPCDDAVMGL